MTENIEKDHFLEFKDKTNGLKILILVSLCI